MGEYEGDEVEGQEPGDDPGETGVEYFDEFGGENEEGEGEGDEEQPE